MDAEVIQRNTFVGSMGRYAAHCAITATYSGNMGYDCAEAVRGNASRILIFCASPTVDVGRIVRILPAVMLHLKWLSLQRLTFLFWSRRNVCYAAGESTWLLSLWNILRASTQAVSILAVHIIWVHFDPYTLPGEPVRGSGFSGQAACLIEHDPMAEFSI